jgi:hypothetical protein
MPEQLLIVCGIVAAVVTVLVGGAMFGVSRRAVESELRHERDAARHDSERSDHDTDLAA